MSEARENQSLPIEPTPSGVWNHVWAEISRLVNEMREALGSHLRDSGLSLHRLSGNPRGGSGEIVIGRTKLLLECPFLSFPPGPDERGLAEVFGSATSLVRVFIYRRDLGGVPHLESLLAADLASGIWVSTDPELGPVPFADRIAFEKFFWGFAIDRC